MGERDKLRKDLRAGLENIELKKLKLKKLEEIIFNRDAILAKLDGNKIIKQQNQVPFMFGYRAVSGDQVDELLAETINLTGI